MTDRPDPSASQKAPFSEPQRPEQIPLALPHQPALSREDFFVAPSNQDAVTWIDAWPQWPDGGGRLAGLALYGPVGCGKSHLAQLWLQHCHGQKLTGKDLVQAAWKQKGQASLQGSQSENWGHGKDAAALLDQGPPHLLLEDLDHSGFFETAGAQRLLFHIHHYLVERQGSLLIASETAPARWPLSLPDLASRLSALASVAMGPPEDSLLEAVLVKLFADRQLRLPVELLHYLSRHMDRSFQAARHIVSEMDRRSMAQSRRLTIPLAREILSDMQEKAEDP